MRFRPLHPLIATAAATLAILTAAGRGPSAGSSPRSPGPPFAGESAPPTPPPSAGEPAFDEVWHDGRAELCGYRLTIERYGKTRRGTGVLITVTEPFSRARHVKVEDPSKDPGDTFEALKVNFVRRFQTGIYDYHTMISLFTDAATFEPVKVAFSSTEWCGQVYEETNFAERESRTETSSYFEDESSQAILPTPQGGVVEDALFVRLRGLRGEGGLAPGERRVVPFLASPFFRRLTHRPAAWSSATIERTPEARTIRVPAGSFTTTQYVVRTQDGREGRFFIERAASRRIVRWAWTRIEGKESGGSVGSRGLGGRGDFLGGTDSGELTGSARLPYWKLHDPGDERYLRDLGLAPADPRGR